jgi:hypothetical protein
MQVMATIYNNISRWELKSSPKSEISRNMDSMLENANTKELAIDLMSDLILIKYNRQTGFWNNVDNVDKQEEGWQRIDANLRSNIHSNLSTPDLMCFVRNNGYIAQRKIPSGFKALLLKLSFENRTEIVSRFPEEERDTLCTYLRDATGEDWSAHIVEAGKLVEHRRFISELTHWKDSASGRDVSKVHTVVLTVCERLGEGNDAGLNLDGVDISTLPPLPPRLTVLSLDNSTVKTLPVNLPAGMTSLSIRNSEVTELPAYLPAGLNRDELLKTTKENAERIEETNRQLQENSRIREEEQAALLLPESLALTQVRIQQINRLREPVQASNQELLRLAPDNRANQQAAHAAPLLPRRLALTQRRLQEILRLALENRPNQEAAQPVPISPESFAMALERVMSQNVREPAVSALVRLIRQNAREQRREHREVFLAVLDEEAHNDDFIEPNFIWDNHVEDAIQTATNNNRALYNCEGGIQASFDNQKPNETQVIKIHSFIQTRPNFEALTSKDGLHLSPAIISLPGGADCISGEEFAPTVQTEWCLLTQGANKYILVTATMVKDLISNGSLHPFLQRKLVADDILRGQAVLDLMNA